MRRLYCTPDGQASTHAMQPRHASQWRDDLRVHTDLAALREVHEQDAAARGIHLLAPEQIGRTRGKAETAVHAVADQRRVRAVVVVERDGRRAVARVTGRRVRSGAERPLRCHPSCRPGLSVRQDRAGASPTA